MNSPPRVPLLSGRLGKILLAEDNIVNQQVLLLRLQQAGFEVLIAANGREAVEVFGEGGIDMILMDLQMPEMDGLRATRLIRSQEKATGSRVPIVAVTANVVEGERQRCVAAGMDDYLSKPVRGKELFETIARLLHLPDVAEALRSHGGHAPKNPSTPSAPSPEEPGWLLVLRSMRFGEEAIRRLVRTFVTTTPERLASLQQAVDLADLEQISLVSHTLEGSLLVFGAQPCAELARRLEQSAREGKVAEAAPLLSSIRLGIQPLLDSMQEFSSGA